MIQRTMVVGGLEAQARAHAQVSAQVQGTLTRPPHQVQRQRLLAAGLPLLTLAVHNLRVMHTHLSLQPHALSIQP